MELAQLNIARVLAPLESPMMQEFVDNLGPINTIAENSPGYIWRLQDDSGDATSIEVFDDPLIIVNMSVWESVESLKDFMFKTHHLTFLKRKAEWFGKMQEPNHVLWWIEKGTIPTVQEAKRRLIHLREHGDSAYAFSFRNLYPPGVIDLPPPLESV